MKRTALTLALLLFSTQLALADDWKKINEEDGIKVFSKDIKGSSLVAFKGETIVDHSVTRVLWVLADNDHRKEWVDRLEKSVVLERISAHEFIVYQHFKLPWYLSDRDYVYKATATKKDDKSGVVYLEMESCEHKKSPKTVGVRAKLVGSKYILTPQGQGNKCKVEVEILTDPKGWLPAWLVNLIQKSWPLKTLTGIKKVLDKSFVKAYPMPPVAKKKKDS